MSSTPPVKRICLETNQDQVCTHIIKQLIIIHNSFNEKVKHLEAKIDSFVSNINVILEENVLGEKKLHCCDQVFKRLSGIEKILKNISSGPALDEDCKKQAMSVSAPVVLLPTQKPPRVQADGRHSNIQVMALNSEADYPDGSWLGDDKNPEARVRVPIPPSQLLHINNVCTTPEKMAIVLLDYLFTQETQARSNLSGKGKHLKEQLDPLKIYGIKAHLMYKFSITEGDWYRIKQNLDSKCRTAWRKRTMGFPLSKSKVKSTYKRPSGKVITNNSIILAGPFTSEENSQDLQSMIVEDKDCFTLNRCAEQTLTIITDGAEVSVPMMCVEDNLSDDH